MYPDVPLITSRLTTRTLGRRIISFDETPSTNTLAKQLAKDGEQDGTLVICRKQTAGRGRMGRTWFSDPDGSICMSIIIRPAVSPELFLRYTPAFAVAVARVMRKLGAFCEIKWPNDIVADGRKLCGILSESGITTDGAFLVCGIGINAGEHFEGGESYISTRPDADCDYKKKAVSVFDLTGESIPREIIIAGILNEAQDAFSACGDDMRFAELLSEYARYSCVIGRAVTVYGESERHGVAKGIDCAGRLIVETDAGEIVVSSDDVSVRLR